MLSVWPVLQLEVAVFCERGVEKGAACHNLDVSRLAIAQPLLVEQVERLFRGLKLVDA